MFQVVVLILWRIGLLGLGNLIFSNFWDNPNTILWSAIFKKHTTWKWRSRYSSNCLLSSKSYLTRLSVANIIKKNNLKSLDDNLWIARICHLIGKSNLSRLIYKRSALVFSSPEDQKKTNTLKKIHEKINNKSLFNEIDYALDNLKFSNAKAPILLTSVSSKYFNLFELWNERINQNLPCEKIVIALDSISVSKLSKYNDLKVLDFSSYFFFDEVSNLPPLIRQNLWILRTAITKSLLKYNRKIYLLDLDAIVVDKGLPEFIDTLPHHDIVGQLGKFEIPLDVVKKFGFVICCGVLIINPSFKVANFFEKFFTRVVAELDDQVALNHFLEHEGIKNFKSNSEYLSFESHDLQWILPSNKYISRSLDYGIYIRHTPKAHNLKLFN